MLFFVSSGVTTSAARRSITSFAAPHGGLRALSPFFFSGGPLSAGWSFPFFHPWKVRGPNSRHCRVSSMSTSSVSNTPVGTFAMSALCLLQTTAAGAPKYCYRPRSLAVLRKGRRVLGSALGCLAPGPRQGGHKLHTLHADRERCASEVRAQPLSEDKLRLARKTGVVGRCQRDGMYGVSLPREALKSAQEVGLRQAIGQTARRLFFSRTWGLLKEPASETRARLGIVQNLLDFQVVTRPRVIPTPTSGSCTPHQLSIGLRAANIVLRVLLA